MNRALGALAHAGVDQLEDVAPTLAQLQRELVEAAGQARIAVATARTRCNELTTRAARLDEQVEQDSAVARDALVDGNEPMARAAIERRRAREEQRELARTQCDQAKTQLDAATARRDQISRELVELRDRREQLEERSRLARSLNPDDKSPQIAREPIAEVVARMERKVTREEALATHLLAPLDLDESTAPGAGLDDYIEQRAVEAELLALKTELTHKHQETNP